MEDNENLINDSDKNNVDPLKKGFIEVNSDKKEKNMINKISVNNNLDQNNENKSKDINTKFNSENEEKSTSINVKIKPKKEIPIEKKPFNEFINDHLLPSLIQEFKERGLVVEDINLKNTLRPIAGDKCWVVYCEIKEICNFWLSFEKDDISSLKSISLCKFSQQPSVIESFLIDEKRITLKLIISRILQRLNGQKLIGIN